MRENNISQSDDELWSEIFTLVTVSIYAFGRLKAVFQGCAGLLISACYEDKLQAERVE